MIQYMRKKQCGGTAYSILRQGTGAGASGRREPPAQQCVPRQRRYGCRFDIIFLQKRNRPIEIEPEWVHTGIRRNPGENADGFAVNQYFIDHPEMVPGRQSSESTQYGRQDFTVAPIEGADLAEQLSGAIRNIRGTYAEAELPDLGEDETIVETIPADPNVRNFSYTVVDGELYYRQNSIMTKPDFNATAKERAKGMVEYGTAEAAGSVQQEEP